MTIVKSITYLGYDIDIAEDYGDGTHYPYKIGINGIYDSGYAPNIENAIDLAKEFVRTIIKIKPKEL